MRKTSVRRSDGSLDILVFVLGQAASRMAMGRQRLGKGSEIPKKTTTRQSSRWVTGAVNMTVVHLGDGHGMTRPTCPHRVRENSFPYVHYGQQ